MTEALLPVALVGAGRRSETVYGPLLAGPLGNRAQLCALVSRGKKRGSQLAEELGLPFVHSLDEAVSRHGARAAILCASSPENHRLAHQSLDLQLPALLETPLAFKLNDARALAARVEQSSIPIEVAEQNPRFLEQRFWKAVIDAGIIGTPRFISCDRAGYRYHATAVARQLLGRPTALQASGRRALLPIKGHDQQALYSGTIACDGGAVFQLTDGEALWQQDSPWTRGSWAVLGEEGSLGSPDLVIGRTAGQRQAMVIERVNRKSGKQNFEAKLILHCATPIEVTSPFPGERLTDDQQAAALCLLDWLARINGEATATSWSAQDGLADLEWICALERSAVLAGSPIRVEEGLRK